MSAVNNNGAIVEFNEGNATDSFDFKAKITGQTVAKYEISLDLTWSENWVIVSTNNANQGGKFAITETKRYVPVVTLST